MRVAIQLRPETNSKTKHRRLYTPCVRVDGVNYWPDKVPPELFETLNQVEKNAVLVVLSEFLP